MKFVDLTGKKFGLLTVTKELGNNRIECQCDCGVIKEYDKYKVKTGHTKSCGCNRYNFVNDTQFKRTNRVGETFNALTIIKELGHDKVICRCNLCGNTKEMRKSKVVLGEVKSCGCLKGNFIDLTGKTFGDLTVINQVQTNPVKWLCKCKCGNTTVLMTARLTSNGTTCCRECFYKKVIPKLNKGLRKFLTHRTNVKIISKKKAFKNNFCGVRGISIRKHQNSYQARICFRGEKIYLGTFSTLQEAKLARKKAEKEYFLPAIKLWNKNHSDEIKIEE